MQEREEETPVTELKGMHHKTRSSSPSCELRKMHTHMHAHVQTQHKPRKNKRERESNIYKAVGGFGAFFNEIITQENPVSTTEFLAPTPKDTGSVSYRPGVRVTTCSSPTFAKREGDNARYVCSRNELVLADVLSTWDAGRELFGGRGTLMCICSIVTLENEIS
ncbi:hypothetical protein HZ326_10874 [Fusarium oxysporum f. sp. albedinis]|nr:hypothetical protein HZ326_10874 [Fusarium oxysporum f. sp. albedinis]